MAMHQHMVARTQMSQQLRMTPQLQQAIKLLQLSRLELIDMVQQEMVENPVLEEIAKEPVLEDPHPDPQPQEAPKPKEAQEERLAEVRTDEGEDHADKIDWERFVENVSTPLPGNSYKGLSEDTPNLEQTLSTSENLVDHLLEQLRMSSLDEEQQYIALMIIGNLDPAGYLREQTCEELAGHVGAQTEEVETVLDVLQSFDPVGVCARTLEECLLIQLERFHHGQKLAYKIVEHHIADLERKSYNRIVRARGASLEEVIAAAKLIASLEPRPGRMYEEVEASYITPDIYITKHEGGYRVSLNEDGLPKLRVSSYYKQEIKNQKGKISSAKHAEAKEYIQDKLRGAMWLIRSIQQRQSTILKVTESILKFQGDFFEKGVEHLKPLVLRDVADDIEMHESTVSRVTTNKYVHTPRGIYELKFFFNSSITKHGGDDLASEAVKAKIKEIVSGENPKKPLSDSKIVEILAKEDIDIARRTVAKYREMMGILSSGKRKCMF